VRVTNHARQRLVQRGISLQEVEHIRQHADTTYTTKDGKRWFVGEAGGRRIKILLDAVDEVLITAAVQD
jgi:hypothetical protein